MKIGGQRIPGKTLVLIASEAALIAFGLVFATALRFRNINGFGQEISQPDALLRYGIVILVCGLALYYYDLYDLQVVTRRSVLFVRLLQALGSACLLLAFIYYWDPDLSLGRGVAALAAPLIIISVAAWRLVVDTSAPFLRRNERILIVGDGPAGSRLAAEILRRPELNIQIVGLLNELDSFASGRGRAWREIDSGASVSLLPMQYSLRYAAAAARCGPTSLAMAPALAQGILGGAAVAADEELVEIPDAISPRVLGTTSEVERYAVSERADRVVLSLSERRGGTPIQQLLRLKFVGMKIEEAHNMYERTTGRILLDHLSPSWLFLADGFHQPPLVLAAKRTIDIVISTIGLVFALPLLVLVALAIFVESGSPILFRQQRIGRNGRPFKILKFRSMRKEAPTEVASWTSSEDPRITHVGRFIRKFRIDELPQLINVLQGEMSLVGPRPEQPSLAQMLEQRIPYYAQRHSLRPGITGWAQVKYGYGGTIEQNKVKLEHDLFYIKHLSMPLDLAIIFETVKVLLSGRGAK